MSSNRAAVVVVLLILVAGDGVVSQQPRELAPQPKPIQRRAATAAQIQLEQVREFIGINEAVKRFNVDGTGLTAAVLDTGVYAAHIDFDRGRKIAHQLNLTKENRGDRSNARDGHGHGTNVAGIIAANSLHRGVATGARLVAIKVFDDAGNGTFDTVREALDWLRGPEAAPHGISVVNLSLSDYANMTTDAGLEQDMLRVAIAALHNARIPVVVSAGNWYKREQKQGMTYPAILHETISAGSVYDAPGGTLSYPKYYDAQATARVAGQLTPFSQRLHESVGGRSRTDIFAPGAPVTATGIQDPTTGTSTQEGTSQAAPVTSGVILLMQQLYRRKFPNQLPEVSDIERWLREGARVEFDGDNEVDNVAHTQLSYPRLDAVRVLEVMSKELGL